MFRLYLTAHALSRSRISALPISEPIDRTMNGKLSFLLLSVAVLAFACGPRPRNADTAAARTHHRATDATLVSALDVNVGDGVDFDFYVTNNGDKKVEVNFPSGRTHDVIVLDSLGNEVWRWSKGRMFTQSLQNKILRSADTLTYAERWTGAPRGRYTAVASLASANFPVEQRIEFTVR